MKTPFSKKDEQVPTDATGVLDMVVGRAMTKRASDVHWEPRQDDVRVRFRIDGVMVEQLTLDLELFNQIVTRAKVLARMDITERRTPQDGQLALPVNGQNLQMRASTFPTVNGEKLVLRLFHGRGIIPFEDLGLPGVMQARVRDLIGRPQGFMVTAGPTGAGKTSTLYALLALLDVSRGNVVTLEDPVEVELDGITQAQIHPRAGFTFATGLRSLLRQDPDVILVGEVRDHESANMAIHCALTGHKVLTTLHTEDTVSAVVRLLQMDIEPFLVASTMSAVLGQRLLRRPCAHCRADHVPTAAEQRSLALHGEDLSAYTFTRSTGCPNCHYTGYRGRVGVYELLVMTDALRDAVLQKRPAHEIRRIAQESPGFYSLQEDGIAKALHGLTTLSEVIGNCPRLLTNRRLRQLQELY
jgi:type II secretory ATPase GspE/PulE/Tfp pilus assembly ATPase PilB-like protein